MKLTADCWDKLHPSVHVFGYRINMIKHIICQINITPGLPKCELGLTHFLMNTRFQNSDEKYANLLQFGSWMVLSLFKVTICDLEVNKRLKAQRCILSTATTRSFLICTEYYASKEEKFIIIFLDGKVALVNIFIWTRDCEICHSVVLKPPRNVT